MYSRRPTGSGVGAAEADRTNVLLKAEIAVLNIQYHMLNDSQPMDICRLFKSCNASSRNFSNDLIAEIPKKTYEKLPEKTHPFECANPVDSLLPVRVAGDQQFGQGRECDVAGIPIQQ